MIDINKNFEPITKKNIKFNLLFNKYQIYGYIFIFLASLMNSASYIVLYYIIENKDITLLGLLIFFITLGLSFLFVYPMRLSLVHSIIYSRELLLNNFLAYINNKKLIFHETKEKNKYTALLRTNVSYIAKEYCDFYFHLVLSLSVLIASTAVLYYIHGIIYVIVVIIVLFFVVFSIKLIAKEHKKLSSEMEDTENSLSQSLEHSWDLITVDAQYYKNFFLENLKTTFSNVEKKTIFQEKYYRLRITFISLLVIVIFAVTTFYLFLSNNFTIPQLVVILPILNLILNHTLNVARELAFANNLEGRLDSILKIQNLDDTIKGIKDNLIKRINLDLITIIDMNSNNELKFSNIKDLENFILKKEKGLYFIKGKNGSGKSSLLTLLSSYFQDCIYSPTIPVNLENNEKSTGQIKIQYILKQIEFSREKAAILIDEPYSNLSDKNKILNILTEEAKNRLVLANIH